MSLIEIINNIAKFLILKITVYKSGQSRLMTNGQGLLTC